MSAVDREIFSLLSQPTAKQRLVAEQVRGFSYSFAHLILYSTLQLLVPSNLYVHLSRDLNVQRLEHKTATRSISHLSYALTQMYLLECVPILIHASQSQWYVRLSESIYYSTFRSTLCHHRSIHFPLCHDQQDL